MERGNLKNHATIGESEGEREGGREGGEREGERAEWTGMRVEIQSKRGTDKNGSRERENS